MSRSCLLLAVLVASAPLQAQKTRFGFAVGKGFVGSGDSRTLVNINGDTVTGADQAGLHVRAFAVVPLSSTNPDPQSTEVAESLGGMGLGRQTGIGLRVRMGQRNLLLEWRYSQALNNTRGAASMPLTVGITF